MPDSQAIPIPQGLDLCGSIADQTLFVQLLNLNFDLVVKVIEEQQSISLTLPGVPSMLIPGFPGIQIPGLSPFDIGIQAERQSLETAWIGNRILRGVPYDKRRATGRYGGTQGVKVGGTDLSIPGSDPFTVTMQYVELNFQIITQLVPSITTLPMLLPGAPGSLCSLPDRQAIINNIISIINTQFEQAIVGGSTPPPAPPECAGMPVLPISWNGPPVSVSDPQVIYDYSGGASPNLVGGPSISGISVTLSTTDLHLLDPPALPPGCSGTGRLCTSIRGVWGLSGGTGLLQINYLDGAFANVAPSPFVFTTPGPIVVDANVTGAVRYIQFLVTWLRPFSVNVSFSPPTIRCFVI